MRLGPRTAPAWQGWPVVLGRPAPLLTMAQDRQRREPRATLQQPGRDGMDRHVYEEEKSVCALFASLYGHSCWP